LSEKLRYLARILGLAVVFLAAHPPRWVMGAGASVAAIALRAGLRGARLARGGLAYSPRGGWELSGEMNNLQPRFRFLHTLSYQSAMAVLCRRLRAEQCYDFVGAARQKLSHRLLGL
jgi:hypothetical protein